MEAWKEKVALHLSLHGSNTLRGGPKLYNSNVLIGNWQNDRVDPYHSQKLTSSRVYHPAYPSSPPGSKYQTTYLQEFDYEDWSRRPTQLSKYGLLGHDDSGPESWTTESRFEYRNPVQRREDLIAINRWSYGREEDSLTFPRNRRARGGREEFVYLHPMKVRVSPRHKEEFLRAISPRPAHERVPPALRPPPLPSRQEDEEKEKQLPFTSPYSVGAPGAGREELGGSKHHPSDFVCSSSSAPPRYEENSSDFQQTRHQPGLGGGSSFRGPSASERAVQFCPRVQGHLTARDEDGGREGG